MSDYEFRPGGSLKLKGGVAGGGIVKKKKSSKSKKGKDRVVEQEGLGSLLEEAKAESPSGSSRNSPAIGGGDKKTTAEKRFEDVQRKRLASKVAKLANTTHKERVNDFNTKLEMLSEHHDIPKVGPG